MKEHQKHIFAERFTNERDDGIKVAFCGEEINGWNFLSIDHAVNTILSGSRLLPCPDCARFVIEKLSEAV